MTALTLLDALDNYDALMARIPLHQWRIDESPECDKCECEYVQVQHAEAMSTDGTVHPLRRSQIKICTHDRAAKAHFLRPMAERTSDGLDVAALRADIDRQIDAMPGLARDLFHLRYRTFIRDTKTGERRQPTLVEVRQKLRRPWTTVIECHALHFRRMEQALRDWFPGGISRRIA